MYEAQNSQRGEAEKALVEFQNSLNALPKCQMLLDRGESSYSQLLAATTLTKLISKNAQGLSLQEIVDIRFVVSATGALFLSLTACLSSQKLHSKLFGNSTESGELRHSGIGHGAGQNHQIWLVLFTQR